MERMRVFGVYWAYFACWEGSFLESMPPATLSRIYQSPAVITVDELNVRPSVITSGSRMSGGAFQLTGRGPRGATFRVLASSNVTTPPGGWVVVTNSRLSGGVFTVIDRQATNQTQRFYRAVVP
jgi:hypothetical protein